jgi:hypothetical protein
MFPLGSGRRLRRLGSHRRLEFILTINIKKEGCS